MLLWFSVIAIVIIFTYFKIYKPLQKWKELGVPYLKPIPILGNLGPFLFQQKNVGECLIDMYKMHDSRYVGIYEFHTPILILKDLNLIKQIGIKDFDHFVDHRTFISEEYEPLWGKNLFLLRSEKWRNMRSTLSPAFTGSKMRSMYVLMSDCAKQFTRHFEEEIQQGDRKIVEMKDILSRYASDVIASCAFGITCDSMKDKNNEFLEMGNDASNFGGIRMFKFFGYNICPSLMKMLNIKIISDKVSHFFRNIITTNIRSREEQGIIRPDLIHLLMEARKGKLKHETHGKDEDAGFATVEESQVGKAVQAAKRDLSDDDITAQALLFFLAGFDTISLAMCHMAYELALNEDIQRKLQEEIDETFRECNGQVTYEALIKMKYLDMVLSETLRKCPPLPAIDRICHDSYTIKPENPNEREIHLKKNDVIWFPPYALHHDPQYFPDPEKFDPERFSDENKMNIIQGTYIPFGIGPRNCIGSRFALLEAKVVFCNLLLKFNLEICEKSQVPLKLSKKHFNLSSDIGFWLAIKPRNLEKSTF